MYINKEIIDAIACNGEYIVRIYTERMLVVGGGDDNDDDYSHTIRNNSRS